MKKFRLPVLKIIELPYLDVLCFSNETDVDNFTEDIFF